MSYLTLKAVSSPLNWVFCFHCQAFLDDYCATAAESLLKHVLLRAKGRVALRHLSSSSTASSHNNRDHHGYLSEETSSMSSSISCKSKSGDEDEVEATTAIGSHSAAESPLGGMDVKSDNSYDDEDDAFDDSSIDDDDDAGQASSPNQSTPAIAPTILSVTESPAASPVPSINRMTQNADNSAAAFTPPGSSLSGDVPSVDPGQQREQQHRQQLQQQASAVLATPSPAHTGTVTTPRTSPLSSVAVASEKGGSNRDGDISTEEQDRVAHPTSGSGKTGCSDKIGKLRKQRVPVSARR